jgi:hypothetical protein
MERFEGRRVSHEYTQHHVAAPDRVFSLLCPVREAEWVPGWQYRLIYSTTGVAEAGCVFLTPNEDGSETTWMVTEYDPAGFRIAFVWVHPGMVCARIAISLHAKREGSTRTSIRYTYTGLSGVWNEEGQRYDEAWFRHEMESWEAAINHYLQTGRRIDAAVWK